MMKVITSIKKLIKSTRFQKISDFLKEHLLAILTSSFFIIYGILNTYDMYGLFLNKITLFGSNLYHYFKWYFNPEEVFDPQILDIFKNHYGHDLVSLIPIDVKEFGNRFVLAYRVMISDGWWKAFGTTFSFNTAYLSMFLTLILLFIPLIFISIDMFFVEKDFEYNDNSKSLKCWNVLYKNKILPVLNWFKNRYISIVNKNYVKISLIIGICLYFNVPNLFFDFFCYYFYFITQYKLKNLWDLLVVLIIDLTPILINIPLWVYLLSFYVWFCSWRKKNADNVLRHHEAINCGMIKGSGVLIMINGAPGSGKTKLQTDMAITTEMMFRQQSKEIMDEIRDVFPNFRWDLIRKKVDVLVKLNLLKNISDCESYFLKYFDLMLSSGSLYFNDNNFMNYDLNKYGFEFNNGLINENLFNDIIDYSKSYFIYQSDFALLLSNYPIRVDHMKYQNEHFINWSYDWFIKEASDILPQEYSKVVDYDMLRLKRKKDNDNPNNNIPIAYVFALTELGKERGNTLENQELRKRSDETNQKNDGFTDYLRVGRHPATIRHRTFFKIFYDEQRASSCGIALSGITEDILTIDKKRTVVKNAMHFYFLRLLIIQFFRNLSGWFFDRFEQVRNDSSLITIFFAWISKISNRSYIRYINRYNYEVIYFYQQNGTLPDGAESDLKLQKYYLSYRKIFANRYASDYLRSYFDELGKNATHGIGDLISYQDVYPDWAREMQSQNSYMVKDYSSNLPKPDEDQEQD